jgi:hypothetical protein
MSYGNEVNVLGQNVNILKKDTGYILVASKEVDVRRSFRVN